MALSDYEHWNEEAPLIWWQEEGKHNPDDIEPDVDDWYDSW